ncbi:MAG: CvpA family protein [Candidatus Omnitrophica bacterium]|nr:CvpA family protein [Candidatus Omnitrophota bacterium]
MVIDIIKSINWADLLILALSIRIMYMAANEGFIVEIFKCFSMIIALFLSFHYYFFFAKLLTGISFLSRQIENPEDMVFTQSACFIVIWILPLIAFKYIREGLLLLFSIKTKPVWDRWAGSILGIGRCLVVASMLMFVLLISGIPYLEAKTVESFLGKRVVKIAPGMYKNVCDGFVSRLFSGQKYNQAVREALDKISLK